MVRNELEEQFFEVALGVAIASFAVFLFVAALRVRAWKEFALRLDENAMEIPVRPFSRRETLKIPLVEIEQVSYAGSGAGPRLEVLTRGGLHLLPFRWFPDDVKPADVALRVHVRSQLARAQQTLEPAELAAIEATMLAGKSFGAFVVERLDEPPEVVATLDAKAEEDGLAQTLKGKGAKLYDCAERIRALREALERGFAAPVLPTAKAKAE